MGYFREIARFAFRGFALFLTIFSFGEGLLLSDWRGIALGTYMMFSVIVNDTLKYISKLFFGKKGERPDGAKNCGPIITKKEPEFVKASYGMPSGHAQNFAFVATLAAIGICEKSRRKEDFYLPLKLGALFILTAIAMYMRVMVEKCHTGYQVIVGACIGVILSIVLIKYIKLPNPFGSKIDIKRWRKKRKI